MSYIEAEQDGAARRARRAARERLFDHATGLVGLRPDDIAAAGRALDLLGDTGRLRYVEQLVRRSRPAKTLVRHEAERNHRSLLHRLETLRDGGVVERRGAEYAVRSEALKQVARYVDLLHTLSALHKTDLAAASARTAA